MDSFAAKDVQNVLLLREHLITEENIEKLIVCGLMTHMCVDTTVRAAMDYGYKVDLVADACATMDLEICGEIIPAQIVQKTFIASLAGVFANII